MAKGAWVMRTAVLVSILAHASLIGAAGLRKPAAPPIEPPTPADVWAGTTALPVGGEELQEVDVVGSSGAEAAPAAPPAPAPPEANDSSSNDAPTEPPPPPVVPEKPVQKDKPAPKPKAPPAPKPEVPPPAKDEPAPASEEKTADAKPVPKDKPEHDEHAVAPPPVAPDKPAPREEPAPEPEKKPSRFAKAPKPSSAAPAAAGSADVPSTEAKGPSTSGSFGSEGNASVRDLGRAFTRALPPACDSDATWGKLAVGSPGSVEVAVIINEEGKIEGFDPISKNPPAHLLNAVKRTLALLKGGTFALQGGSVTAGRQVLRLSVELSDEPAPAEESSGAAAFGLASRWEGKKGVASFTQTSGRHVEITVEFVRVEPRKE